MEKRAKRIEEVVNHLVGTSLPLHAAMTQVERSDVDFTRAVLNKMVRRAPHLKWERINVAS